MCGEVCIPWEGMLVPGCGGLCPPCIWEGGLCDIILGAYDVPTTF
jgi:hypothetical protein